MKRFLDDRQLTNTTSPGVYTAPVSVSGTAVNANLVEQMAGVRVFNLLWASSAGVADCRQFRIVVAP